MKHRETDLDTLGLSHKIYEDHSARLSLYLFTAKYDGRYKSEKFYLT